MTYKPKDKQDQPSMKIPEQPPPKQGLRLEWILVPLALLGMAYVLRNTHSTVTWKHVMDLLQVKNRERYTMLFHLCLALTCVVAAIRILSRNNKE